MGFVSPTGSLRLIVVLTPGITPGSETLDQRGIRLDNTRPLLAARPRADLDRRASALPRMTGRSVAGNAKHSPSTNLQPAPAPPTVTRNGSDGKPSTLDAPTATCLNGNQTNPAAAAMPCIVIWTLRCLSSEWADASEGYYVHTADPASNVKLAVRPIGINRSRAGIC